MTVSDTSIQSIHVESKIKYIFIAAYFFLLTGCSNNGNPLNVQTKDGLSIDKIEIRNGFTSINRENDLQLFSIDLKTIFNGSNNLILKTDFGENDFLIIYNDSCYYSFRHFIYTDFVSSYPSRHDYNFEFFKRNDSILLNVNIEGEQPMNFTRALIEKEFAEQYKCNTPIEKAGVMFNMTEMEEKN